MQLYTQSKEEKKENCQGIVFDDVVDLIPKDNAIILKMQDFPFIAKIELSKDDFFSFKFEAIRWIKKKEDPIERFWKFETELNGVWSYDRELLLVEARKTRKEKEDEREEHNEMLKLFKKHGITH